MLGNLTGESFFSNSLQNVENAMFGVFRFKKDILGSSNIGILAATKENRENYNRIVGLDGSFMLNSNDIIDFQVASGQTELEYNQNMAYNLAYVRTGDLVGVKLNFDRTEPAFEINRIGYIQKEPDRGWNKWIGLFRISPRINKYHIRRITANLEYEYNRDLFTSRYIDTWLERYPEFIPDSKFGTIIQSTNEKRTISGGIREANSFQIGGDVTVNLINEMSVSTQYKYFSAIELTGNYTGNLFKLDYSTRPLSLGAQFAGKFSASGGTFYNFDQKYVGSQGSFSVDGEGRLSHNVLIKLQGGYTKTCDDDNETDGRHYKLSSNSTWMFTKDFFIRVHAQGIFGTTYYEQKQIHNDYLLSGLLSWEYRPGSFLYLAYNEAWFNSSNSDLNKHLEFKNRTIVLKISYFFSI